jgi:MYXO-CTERM domain-containing protein
MPLLLYLTAFLPTPEGLQVGPDAPHLDSTPSLQVALSAQPGARQFRDRWGAWVIRWDERDHTPRALMGQGVPVDQLDAFVRDVAALSGVALEDLVLVRKNTLGEAGHWNYQQLHQGAPVEGGVLDVHAEGGRIHGAFVSLHRPRLSEAPAPGQSALWHEGEWTWVERVEDGDLVRFLSEEGLVHQWTEARHLDVELEERAATDALMSQPAQGVLVEDDEGWEHTASDGSHARAEPFSAVLDGPELTVRDNGTLIELDTVTGDVLVGGEDIPLAAASVLHHFHVAWDWLEDVRPGHVWLARNVPANVRAQQGCCNAYYTSGTITFLVGADWIYDLGRFADVIYHELGHGFHHYVLEGGSFAGDISEGSADYVSATINDDPVLAKGVYVNYPEYSIREIDTDKVYPDDVIDEVHADGLIWASFLWNLRARWVDALGEEAGVAQTDALFLESLSYGPTMTDVGEAVLLADDDDGDLSNGTPHACELAELLDLHGLGPGEVGVLVLEHEPLGAQGSSELDYPVDFGIWNLLADCGELDASSVQLHVAVEAGDPDDYDSYELIEVADLGGGAFEGVIPRAFPGQQVHYFVSFLGSDGATRVSSHGELSGGAWSFWVGDREDVWCEDFESGDGDWSFAAGLLDGRSEDGWSSEWAVGAPGGGQFDPAAPFEGASILGTELGELGDYSPNNGQRALGPQVELLGEGQDWLLLLTSQRFLTVEDGIYDHARVAFLELGAEAPLVSWLYENPATGSGGEHVIDTAWVQHELDLSGLAGRAGHFGWDLQSDQGLEFGGWNLDNVCVQTLADVPGHYRVRDLVASDDQEQVTVTWTHPWMQPLHGVALVRSLDGPPASLEDGVILDIDLAPQPGVEQSYLDEDIGEGETAWYAAFAWQDGETLHDEPVEGENLDQGGVPEPEPVDSPVDSEPQPEDSDAPADEPPVVEAEPTCSCGSVAGSSPGTGAAVLALTLGLVLLRRRRSTVG